MLQPIQRSAKPLFKPGVYHYNISSIRPPGMLKQLLSFYERTWRGSDTMNAYTFDQYREINAEVARTGQIPSDMETDFFPSPYRLLVFRGDANAPVMRRGRQYKVPKLLSCSLSLTVANRFAHGESLFQIILPKGTSIAVGNPREDEIILPPYTPIDIDFVLENVNLQYRASAIPLDRIYICQVVD